MNDETQMITKTVVDKENPATESHILNISIRGWITFIVVSTVCGMSIFTIEVKEPLYTMAGMMIAFYFGQTKQTTPPKTDITKQ